jgi:hypothetical protein
MVSTERPPRIRPDLGDVRVFFAKADVTRIADESRDGVTVAATLTGEFRHRASSREIIERVTAGVEPFFANDLPANSKCLVLERGYLLLFRFRFAHAGFMILDGGTILGGCGGADGSKNTGNSFRQFVQ